MNRVVPETLLVLRQPHPVFFKIEGSLLTQEPTTGVTTVAILFLHAGYANVATMAGTGRFRRGPTLPVHW